MVCQVQLLDVPNIDQAVKVILGKENQIIEHGNMFVSESMRKRGGGVVKIIPSMRNQFYGCLTAQESSPMTKTNTSTFIKTTEALSRPYNHRPR